MKLAAALFEAAIPEQYVWRPAQSPRVALTPTQRAAVEGLWAAARSELHKYIVEFPEIKERVQKADDLFFKNVGIHVGFGEARNVQVAFGVRKDALRALEWSSDRLNVVGREIRRWMHRTNPISSRKFSIPLNGKGISPFYNFSDA